MPVSVAITRLPTELCQSADLAVAVEVFVEALLDPRQQARRHLVVAALGGDHGAQLGVEVERLQAIRTTLEVSVDGLTAVVGELAVEKDLELPDRVVAISHCSPLPARRHRV